jgi:RHS repeat-associated protein
LSYDGLGQNVQIVENSGGTVTSTKQFVWADANRREERNVSGSVTKQFFTVGQRNFSGSSGSNFYYTIDHLGSVRETTDSSQNVLSQRAFDPFGRMGISAETISPDVGYAGYYPHTNSGLYLALKRAYSSNLGRWLSRDIGSDSQNLYSYVANKPIAFTDPFGLFGTPFFVSHYFDGNGTPVNLGDIDLGQAFQNSAGVIGIVSRYTDEINAAAQAHARSICAGASGTKSLPFSLPLEQQPGGVVVAPYLDFLNPLWAVGRSSIYTSAKCQLVADCCHRTYKVSCESHFFIEDWFQDPFELGIEISTPYEIDYGFFKDIQSSGRF